MIGWLIALILLGLFLLMKVGVRLKWDHDAMVLKIRIGWFRFSLPAGEKKEKTPSKPASQGQAKPKGKKISPVLKAWLKALWENIDRVFAFLGKLLRAPVLDLLRVRITVGGSDPAACAMIYGKLCAGISAALPAVTRLFRIRQQDMDVSCRFDLPKTEVVAEAELTLRVYQIFAIAAAAIALLLKIYRTKNTMEKAVQNP